MTIQLMEERTRLEQELVVARSMSARREEAYQRSMTPQGEAPPEFRAHGRGRENTLRLWILAREAIGPLEEKLVAAEEGSRHQRNADEEQRQIQRIGDQRA